MKNKNLVRASATENTFLILDNLDVQEAYSKTGLQEITQKNKLDGFLILNNKEGYDFEWDFYNTDGSAAEMCGNAARGAALYYFNKTQKKDIHFLTLAGPVRAQILGPNRVSVELPPYKVVKENLIVEAVQGDFINTGVPHFVVEGRADFDLGQKLRNNLNFPEGSNITFIKKLNAQACQAVSFERGVENFTRACGTGAVAAAVSLNLKNKSLQKIYKVEMPGGELIIDLSKNRPVLTGQAEITKDLKL